MQSKQFKPSYLLIDFVGDLKIGQEFMRRRAKGIMRNVIFGLIVSVCLFTPQASKSDSAGIVIACKEPTSETCILTIFEAARVEITKMGHADDFDGITGLPAQARSLLMQAKSAAELIEDPDERQKKLESIAALLANVEPDLASAMMWVASVVAYSAIGGDAFDAYPAVGNAMVPDIMALWERLLVRLEEKQRLPLLGSKEWGMELPTYIIEYQMSMGFVADGLATLDQYKTRASDIEDDADEWLLEITPIMGAFELLQQVADTRSDAGSQEITRFVAENGTEGYEVLTKALIALGRIEEAHSMIGRITDTSSAAGRFSSLIETAPETVTTEAFAAFLIDHANTLERTDIWYLMYSFADTGRIEEVKPTIDQIHNANTATTILLELNTRAPGTVTPDELTIFAATRGDMIDDERRLDLARALVKAHRFDDARLMIGKIEEAGFAADALVTIIDADPTKFTPKALSDFLITRGEMIDDKRRSQLARALANALRFEEARSIIEKIEDADLAAGALVTIIETEPNEITPEELSDFLAAHGDMVDDGRRSELAQALAEAHRVEEARSIIEKIIDASHTADALATLIETEPTEITPEELSDFLTTRGDMIDDESRSELAQALAKAHRFKEARSMIEKIKDASRTADALVTIIKAAPVEITLEEHLVFLATRGETFSDRVLYRLVQDLVDADRFEAVRSMIGKIKEVGLAADALAEFIETAPEETATKEISDFLKNRGDALKSMGLVGNLPDVLVLSGRLEDARLLLRNMQNNGKRLHFAANDIAPGVACGDTEFEGQTALITKLLPEVLSYVDRQPRPCARAMQLSQIGLTLHDARDDR